MNPNDPEPSSRGVYDVEADEGPGFQPVEPLEPSAAEPGWDDDGLDDRDDGYGRFGRDDEYVEMRPPTRGGSLRPASGSWSRRSSCSAQR